MKKYIIAFAMLLALGVAAVGMYMDTKPKPQQVKWEAPWTIEGIHCAVYSDCDGKTVQKR